MGTHGTLFADLPVLEISAPEFFYTHIGKVENAGTNCLRFYCCVLKGNALEPVFTCVMPVQELLEAVRLVSEAAAAVPIRPPRGSH